MNVALVEDDKSIRDGLALYFEVTGCPLKTFENAEDAADSFGADPPDLVISDYSLPGRNGLALLRQVAHDNPRTKRILITAHPNLLAGEDVLVGFDALIFKPFTVGEMEGVLEELIGSQPGNGAEQGKTL